MPGSALEQLVTRLRGVLESLDAVTTTVGLARDRFGEARDVVVEATYDTEDVELVEGIEGMARTVLDLERETERLGVVREVIERYLASSGLDGALPEAEAGSGAGRPRSSAAPSGSAKSAGGSPRRRVFTSPPGSASTPTAPKSAPCAADEIDELLRCMIFSCARSSFPRCGVLWRGLPARTTPRRSTRCGCGRTRLSISQ